VSPSAWPRCSPARRATADVPPFLARFVVRWVAVPVPYRARAVAVALDVGFAGFGLLLALLVALGLGCRKARGRLVSGLGDGLDGLARPTSCRGFDVAPTWWGSAADDCGQDAIGVGRWFQSRPTARSSPLAAPGRHGQLRPGWSRWWSSAVEGADTDELTAWRSGGTEASTTPTANTAQARAMAA